MTVLKTWKSTTIPPKHDVWVTEIKLKSVTPSRLAKVQALLALLGEEVIEKKVIGL